MPSPPPVGVWLAVLAAQIIAVARLLPGEHGGHLAALELHAVELGERVGLHHAVQIERQRALGILSAQKVPKRVIERRAVPLKERVLARRRRLARQLQFAAHLLVKQIFAYQPRQRRADNVNRDADDQQIGDDKLPAE